MPLKRRRSEEAGSSKHSSSDTRPSLTSWSSLPAELHHLIIDLACHDPTPEAASTDRTLPRLNGQTVLSLSLVSHELRGLTQALQYRHINITHVSSLYALCQTLQSRPQLGALIKRLHVGPSTVLPYWWWPLVLAFPPNDRYENRHRLWIRTSLDRERLPEGCDSKGIWLVDSVPEDNCRNRAVYLALLEAQRSLEVSLIEQNMDFADDDSQSHWQSRVLECQAALDLYLQYLARLEEANPDLKRIGCACEQELLPMCCSFVCDHYPPLVLTGTPAPPRPTIPNNAFVLTRSQLLEHLLRPGSVLDCFDHIIHFERSGVIGAISLGASRYKDLKRWPARYSIWHNEFQQNVDEWQGCDSAKCASGLKLATIPSMLQWTRAILSETTSLQDLSLTGYLDQVFCEPQNLPGLRRLSLDPADHGLRGVRTFNGMPQVTELRVSASLLTAEEAGSLVRDLPQLKSLVYDLSNIKEDLLSKEKSRKIADTIGIMLERNGTNAHAGSAEDQKGEGDGSAAQGAPAPTQRCGVASESHSLELPCNDTPLMEIRLHPSTFGRVLATAPSGEVKMAWLTGGTDAGARRRLKLVEQAPSSKDTGQGQPEDLYRESREWWEEVTAGAPQSREPAACAEREEHEENNNSSAR